MNTSDKKKELLIHASNEVSEGFITLAEAAKDSPYSQEYLSLLARTGKIFSKKIGRNWYTSVDAMREYLAKQGLAIMIPRNQLNLSHRGKIKPLVATADNAKYINSLIANTASITDDFNQLNATPDIEQKTKENTKLDIALETISSSLQTLTQLEKANFERLSQPQPVQVIQQANQLPKEIGEFYQIESNSLGHRFKRFNSFSRNIFNNPKKSLVLLIAVVVTLFLVGGGFSFGNVDAMAQRVNQFFKDADSIQGHFAGTHANQVLLLDKAGNVSISGHIETQGQLRSFAPDGVAPIVVDSMTRVDNLNANYLDGLASKDFTLAFVTKQGNITYDDVLLEGGVEIGKSLKVKGATNLLDSLKVYGKLGVFSDAVFSKDVQLSGGNLNIDKGAVNVAMGGVTLSKGNVTLGRGDVELQQGNLKLNQGTIEINNTDMIKNLDSEFFGGHRAKDFNLNFVVGNGNSTNNMAFFDGGLYGSNAAFGSLGVAGDTTIGADDSKKSDVNLTIYSKQLTLDKKGDLTVGGNTSVNNLNVSGNVTSSLVASGSYDLGTASNRWNNVYGTNGNFTNINATGNNNNFSGTSSSSFVINTDNVSSNSEDAYVAFNRGAIKPSAQIKYNSTTDRFEMNQPLRVSSASFSVNGLASISGNAFVGGNLTGNGTGSNSFAGSLLISKGFNAQAIVGTSLTISGNSSFGGTTFSSITVTGQSNLNNASVSGNLELTGTNSKLGINVTNTDQTLEVGGTASISNTLTLAGAISSNFTGSNSFSGSLEVSKGIHATTGLSAATLNISGAASFGSTLNVTGATTLSSLTVTGQSNLANASSSNNFEAANNLIADNILQVGGISATASYSRFGTAITNHANYISAANDVLISGDLEVRSSLAIAGPTSISGATLINNTLTVNNPSNGQGSIIIGDGSSVTGKLMNTLTGDGSLQVLNLSNLPSAILTGSFKAEAGDGTLKDTLSTSGLTLSNDSAINWSSTNATNGTLDTSITRTKAGSLRLGINTSNLGNLTLGTASASYATVLNAINVGLSTPGTATTSYSRFGTSTTSHANYISAANDLLISGDLEVKGSVNFSGNASISNAIFANNSTNAVTLTGNLTGNGTGSNSFAGSLLISKGLNAQAIVGTSLTISGTTTLGTTTLGASTLSSLTVTGQSNLANASSSNNFEAANNLIADNILQVGGISATASYSRFGTAITKHSNYMTAANDVLISGDLEVRSSLAIAGPASISGKTFINNTLTVNNPSNAVGTIILGDGSNVTAEIINTLVGDGTIEISNANGTPSGALTTVFEVIAADGTPKGTFRGNGSIGLNITSDSSINWSNGTASLNTLDTSITRTKAGSLRLGISTSNLGNLTLGTASASYASVLNAINVGLTTPGTATTSYSRFGTSTTAHANYITAADDLLISGDLEVKGSVNFSGNASISNSIFANNSTGNVGIGTSNPIQKLQVSGGNIGIRDGNSLVLYRPDNAVNGTISLNTSNEITVSNGINTSGQSINLGAGKIFGSAMIVQSQTGTGVTLLSGVNGGGSASLVTINSDSTATSGTLLNIENNSVVKFAFDANGNLGIGTTAPTTTLEVQGTASASYLMANGSLQVAGNSSVSYSRFGTTTTSHSNYMSAANDLLISGDLEVKGSVNFSGNASISNSIFANTTTNAVTLTGTLTGNGTGSNSFAGSLLISKGLNAKAIVGTSLTISGNSSFGATTLSSLTVTGQSSLANASSSNNFEATNNLIADNILQVGGSDATASYSRFGTVITRHSNYISAANDVLISGDIEVKGSVNFSGNASISNAIFANNSSGNVGIGTIAPSSKLDLFSTATSTFDIWSGNSTSTDKKFTFQSVYQGKTGVASESLQILNGNGTTLLTLASTGNLGIGTTNPAAPLHIVSTTTAVLLDKSTNDAFSTNVAIRKDRAGAIVQNGDELGYVDFRGYDGTGYKRAALVYSLVDGTPAAGSMPGRLEFRTTPAGSTTAVQRVVIKSNGNVGINSSTPNSKFYIAETTAGATASSSFGINSALTIGSIASISGISLTSGNLFALTQAVSSTFVGNIFVDKDTKGITNFAVTSSGSIQAYNAINAGLGTAATVKYNRFGTSTTNHSNYISAVNDLLISGDLEVKGSVNFSGNASISNSIFANNSTGNVSIGGRPALATKFYVNGNASVSGNLEILGSLFATASPTATFTTASHSDTDINTAGTTLPASQNVTRSVIDKDNLPFVAYASASATKSQLVVTKCGNTKCSSGNTTTTVDTQGPASGVDTIGNLDLITDGGNQPLIAYASVGTSFARIFANKCSNANCTSSTKTALDERGSVTNYSPYVAAVMTTDGLPVIAYASKSPSGLNGINSVIALKCGNSSCSSGNTTTTLDTVTLPSATKFGANIAMAIGGDNMPVVVYASASTGTAQIRVVRCGNSSCSSGNKSSTITTSGANNVSVAVGADGLPVILANGSIIKCGDSFCSQGNITTASVIATTAGAFMRLGNNGLPILSGPGSGNTLRIVKCGTDTCASGNMDISFTPQGGLSGTAAGQTGISIGQDDLPFVTYYQGTAADVFVTHCEAQDCGASIPSYGSGSDIGTRFVPFQNIYSTKLWSKEFQIANFDLAESYKVASMSDGIEAGDIISVSSVSAQAIVKSTKAYDTMLMGIVSTKPGITLSDWQSKSDQEKPIALAGRVPVKVNMENGAIKAGDMITSSSVAGIGMKATRSGRVVGMALESIDGVASGSFGMLTVLVNPHWYGGELGQSGNVEESVAINGQTDSLSSLLGQLASGSSVEVSHASLFDAVVAVFNNIFVKGNIIAQGIKETYHKVADLADITATDIAQWGSRAVEIAGGAPDATKQLLSGNGAQAADQSKLDLKENGNYLATYGVDSTRGEIQLSGSGDLLNGEARVYFDKSFSYIISDKSAIRVIITPTSYLNGSLYVAAKSTFGFIAREIGSQDQSGKFDWLVIARRKGFDDANATSLNQDFVLPSSSPIVSDSPTPTMSTTASTSTATISPDPSLSPSASPTPDATQTLTSATTATPTVIPIVSDTPTPSPTVTDTVSPTPDPSTTTTPDSTPTPTP